MARRRRRDYRRPNPLTDLETIALASAGLGIVAGLGYLLFAKNTTPATTVAVANPTTSTTAPATTSSLVTLPAPPPASSLAPAPGVPASTPGLPSTIAPITAQQAPASLSTGGSAAANTAPLNSTDFLTNPNGPLSKPVNALTRLHTSASQVVSGHIVTQTPDPAGGKNTINAVKVVTSNAPAYPVGMTITGIPAIYFF